MAIETSLSYPQISAQGFAHPADRAAAAALHTIPMLDRVIKKLSEVGYERKLRQLMLGTRYAWGRTSCLKCGRCSVVTPTPSTSKVSSSVCDPVPGGQRPHDRRERTCDPCLLGAREIVRLRGAGSVLAHEMGHVLAEHVTS